MQVSLKDKVNFECEFASLNCYIICCGSKIVYISLYLDIRCLTAADARLSCGG
jgi:hypothetical protein